MYNIEGTYTFPASDCWSGQIWRPAGVILLRTECVCLLIPFFESTNTLQPPAVQKKESLSDPQKNKADAKRPIKKAVGAPVHASAPQRSTTEQGCARVREARVRERGESPRGDHVPVSPTLNKSKARDPKSSGVGEGYRARRGRGEGGGPGEGGWGAGGQGGLSATGNGGDRLDRLAMQ